MMRSTLWLWLMLLLTNVGAFSVPSSQVQKFDAHIRNVQTTANTELLTTSLQHVKRTVLLSQKTDELHTDASSTTRRGALQQAFILGIAASPWIFLNPSMASARGGSGGAASSDADKIVRGYQRLTYLLDHWEEETTVCDSGNDNPYLGCERTPEKVMQYLGFKDTNDPLFRADKTLIRLQASLPDTDKEAQMAYQDALDTWIEKAEEGNGFAYVSSWGEANPGGGKDRVALFIERSKQCVVDCRQSLGTVIKLLDLKVAQ